MVAGSPGESFTRGAAYVFRRPGGGWAGVLNEDAKLIASDGEGGDFFGSSVAISGDTLIAGVNRDFLDRGSAYVFAGSGTIWGQMTNLTASDSDFNDEFGTSVAIDGDTAIVGAPFKDAGDLIDSGAAYVYDAQPTHRQLQTKVDGLDTSNLDVAVSSRASQTSVDALDTGNLDVVVSSRASQASVDALDTSNLDVATSSRASQSSVDALAGDVATLDTSNLNVPVSSRASQASVDALDTSNLDVPVSSRASQSSVNAIASDVATLDTSNLNVPVSSRASQSSVDTLASDVASLDTSNLNVPVSSRASQASVNALDAKLDSLNLVVLEEIPRIERKVLEDALIRGDLYPLLATPVAIDPQGKLEEVLAVVGRSITNFNAMSLKTSDARRAFNTCNSLAASGRYVWAIQFCSEAMQQLMLDNMPGSAPVRRR